MRITTLAKLLCCLCAITRLGSSFSASLTPAAPSVTSGQSVTITSSTPVTWRLAGAGVLTNQTSTSVTFTAPQVAAKNAVLGCAAGPNDNIFNTRVDNLPVDPHSAAWLAAANIDPFSIEVDNWGVSYADNSTPTKSLKTYYGSVNYPNFVMPAQGPNLKRQGGNYMGTFGWTSAPDHHIMTVRRTDCSFYESYDDYLNQFTRACQDGTAGCNVQGAITYKSTDYTLPSGSVTNAGGLPLAPTLWRLDEIKAGNITHAGYLTTFLGGVLANSIRWPATATAGGCAAATCPNAMPMGTRLRLAASFQINSVCNSGIAAQDAACTTMLTALKQYGVILSDTGSTNSAQTLSDISQDTGVSAAIQAIKNARIAMTSFEVVDESSLEVNAGSFAVCPYGSVCLGAANTYEQPQDQAVIMATAADNSVVSTTVSMQGVAIGLGIPSMLPIAAGSYSFQIPSWVNGATDQTVVWTLVSGVGQVTSSGIYTPPATTSGVPETAVLSGTSAANPDAAVQVTVNVLPTGGSPAGSIRIDSGSPTANTDASGNSWLADIGMDGASNSNPNDYPHWNHTSPAASIVYESNSYSGGGDLGNTIVVPNGHYKVHLLFGQNSFSYCDSSCTSWLSVAGTPWDQNSFGPYLLETQGQIQAHSYSYGTEVNFMFQTPTDVWIPAVVSNNLLQVYVRGLSNDVAPYLTPQTSDQHKYIVLNGLEITPDTTVPFWSIDTQQQSAITAGQSLAPFYVVDWYTGRNDPSWSIVSGPSGASISASGVLTLSASASITGQPIVVMASDGVYSATVTITTPAAAPAPVPNVTVSSTALSFGSQTVSSSTAPQSVTLTNAGSQSVAFSSIAISGTNHADFTITGSTCGSALAASASCTVSITFNPSAAGSRAAILSMTDSAGNSPQTVTLSGTGVAASASSMSSATYNGLDASTQGSWTGTYGTDGYMIANATTSFPAYATVAFNGSTPFTWESSVADVRALQTSSASSNRIASTLYANTSFTMDVNLTDGKPHTVALYLLDWSNQSRSETITILDAASHAVLSNQTFSAFQNGQYASWNLSGHVTIQVTNTSSSNAVVSGVFFGTVPAVTAPPNSPSSSSASYKGLDTTTQGTWTGTYGADGYMVTNAATSFPSYATVAFNGSTPFTWESSTSDVRALQTASSSSSRMASTLYANTSFTMDVNLTDGKTHSVALYLLDWSNQSRSETIAILDAGSHAVLSNQTFSAFQNGQYAVWNLSGHVIIQVTNTSSSNAVISGLFFSTVAAPATPLPNAASYLGMDGSTSGTWTGTYGADGSMLANATTSFPSYATVAFTGSTPFTWESSTSDLRALQNASGSSNRIASTLYANNSFTVDVNLTDNHAHSVALYFLDWSNEGRSETISILDAASHVVLSTKAFSGFQNGQYAAWTLSGHVIIQVTNTSSSNAVISGLFFGTPSATTLLHQ
jgi:hypothetical protein